MRDRLAAFNEWVKLAATTVNALGLGIIGFAVLRPLTENLASGTLSTLLWSAAGLASYGIGHYILGQLRRADP